MMSHQNRLKLCRTLALILSVLLYSDLLFAQLSQPDGSPIPARNSLSNILNGARLNEGINVISEASIVPEVFTPAQELTFRFIAEGGGYENAFGWYNLGDDVTNTANRHVIFDCLVEPQNPYVTQTVQFCGNPDWKGGPIGFFLITPEGRRNGGAYGSRNCAQNDGQGYVYFSEPRLNTFEDPQNPYIHHLVYRSNTFENAFYFGFEDLYRGGDNDFEDALILVEGLFVGQAAELCDGLDDDCDGRVDEGVTALCSTECGEGIQECVSGALQACSAPEPSPELCDGVDNDCDGVVDEGLIRDCSSSCGAGAEICVAGDWVGCTAPPQGVERCNNVDDDCDGLTDEALTAPCANGCGVSGLSYCVAGSYGACDAPLPEAERCDALDNDCDGLVDEGLLAPCSSECGAGVAACVNGSFEGCSAPSPSEERCDGIDNDCDGQVDEALTRSCGEACGEVGEELCLVGAWVSCTTRAAVPEQCNDFDDDCDGLVDETLTRPCFGACGEGTQACDSGAWGLCETPAPSEELCDGLDNDCDGATDEALGEVCRTECGVGVTLCEGGAFTGCSAPLPSEERCDGVDNDCDGQIDEALTRACGGACGLVGEELCLGGAWVGCTGRVPSDEVCNGLDEDCDGLADEGLVRSCAGACGEGAQACEGGAWSSCDAPSPVAETCDGVDNDCDGQVDEAQTRACYSVCAEGEQRCVDGAYLDCDAPLPLEERCDGLDNDCDGASDEGLSRACSGACGEGTELCVEGEWRDCSAPLAREESCNGLDDDCDGAADEGLTRSCQTPCGAGTQRCEGGQWSLCPAPEASEELCNANDDDCDGVTDEEASCPADLVCAQGRCNDRCPSGECNVGYECVDQVCLPLPCSLCRSYELCEGVRCVDLCSGVSCEQGAFCRLGECVEGSCAVEGCEEGKVCLEGACVPDDCELARCGPREGCRLGQCFPTCVDVSCEEGERCEGGLCVADGCADLSCAEGERCQEGACVPERCASLSCAPGEVCREGACEADPCLQTRCPAASRCEARSGRAHCEPLAAEEDTEGEIEIEEDVLSVGQDDMGSGGSSAPNSGCESSRSAQHPGSLLLLIFIVMSSARRQLAPARARAKSRQLLTLLSLGLISSACVNATAPAPSGGAEAQGGVSAECPARYETCNGIDDDCNGVIDDVQNLNSDPENCGVCGEVCAFPSAIPLCVGGSCRIARCEEGFLNEDGVAENGCEASCTPSEDGIERCNNRDDDCDGSVDEGFNLGNDLEHCGSCGRACSREGVSELSCISGRCVISACEEGRINQNGLADDGCEYACAPSEGGELCNGEDDDCDGVADEGVEPSLMELGCLSEGLCRGARASCRGGDGAVCIYPEEVTLEGEQRCDGRDEDCDGEVDEGFEGLGEPCDGPDEDLCVTGVVVCSPDRAGVECREAPTFTGERCDGLDNDCDEQVDEGFELSSDPQNCGACGLRCGRLNQLSSCIEGQCVSQGCAEGFYDLNQDEADGCEYACERAEPPLEGCDGADNDCDGRIDEELLPESELTCLSEGVCSGAVALCLGVDGFSCLYPESYLPTPVDAPEGREGRCDGLDNDCDGLVDEGYLGLGELCDGDDEDLCIGGIVVCAADGLSAQCADDELSIFELCDGADNDCDGLVDEGFDLSSDPTSCGECGASCLRANTLARCVEGSCVVDGCVARAYDINGLPLDGCEYLCDHEPSEERCDGVDNDCDARVDEGLTPPPLTCPSLGVCAGLASTCSGALGFTCGFPDTYEPDERRCDGLDNDCDGEVDEGFMGLGELCDGEDDDLCIGGVIVCSADGLGLRCADDPVSIPEVCDGVDNDCDGLADEGFDLSADPQNCGQCATSCLRANAVTSCEGGACVVEGCEEGAYDANGVAIDGCEYLCGRLPSEELCDGLDNDCDAQVDEQLSPPSELSCSALGVCAGVSPLCDGPAGFICPYPDVYQAQESLCDRLDNDCDGLIDEGVEGAAQLGSPCEVGVGQCARRAIVTCALDGQGVSCGAQEGSPSVELCNGLDDDCDGEVDEEVDRALEMAQVSVDGALIWVDLWEASRPDATADQLGLITSHACSKPGVRPWANLNLDQARDACASRGKRLCTEREWRAACGSLAYPYGPSYQEASCVSRVGAAAATGSLASCQSAAGGYDFSGNVAEWAECSRAVDCQLVQPALGGSFADQVADALRCDFRGNAVAASSSSAVGFRCCADEP